MQTKEKRIPFMATRTLRDGSVTIEKLAPEVVQMLADTKGEKGEKGEKGDPGDPALPSASEIFEGWTYRDSVLLKADGTTSSNNNQAYVDFIPVGILGDEDSLQMTNLTNGTSYKGGYYYDSGKNIIQYIDVAGTAVLRKSDMPEGAVWLRFNYAKATKPVITIIRGGASRLDDHDRRLNALDRYEVVPVLNTSVYVRYEDGTPVTNSSYKATAYIPLRGANAVRSVNSVIAQNNSVIAQMAFYDAQKTFLSAVRCKWAEVPEGAAYVRCSMPSTVATAKVVLYGVTANMLLEDATNTVDEMRQTLVEVLSPGLSGKKVVFIGDSITYNSGDNAKAYHGVFASLAGCTAVNLGVNATTIAANPSNNMGNQRFITRATSENLSNADMVVIFGGTNDFSYDTKAIGDLFVEEEITSTGRIGGKRKVPPTDTDTFAGALHELILQVRSIIGEKPIVLMTPLNRGRYSETRPTTRECNVNGDYLSDFVDAIKEIGRFYAIPVFDVGGMLNFDPTDRSSSALTADLLHPNAQTHARIGKLLYQFVTQHICS